MKIGIVSDSLGHLGFEEMLDTVAGLGIEGVEVNACNWTSAPHLDLPKLRADAAARQAYCQAFKTRGLELIALNANGNQLHPTEGERQSADLHETIRLAGQLGIDKGAHGGLAGRRS